MGYENQENINDLQSSIITFKEEDYNDDARKSDVVFIYFITIVQGGVFLFILYNIVNEFLMPLTETKHAVCLIWLLISTFLPTIYLSSLYLTAKKFRHFSFKFSPDEKCFIYNQNKLDLSEIKQVNYTDYSLSPPRGGGTERNILWEITTNNNKIFYFVVSSMQNHILKNILAENLIKPKFNMFKSANMAMFLTIGIYLSFILLNVMGIFGLLIVFYVGIVAIINFMNM